MTKLINEFITWKNLIYIFGIFKREVIDKQRDMVGEGGTQ